MKMSMKMIMEGKTPMTKKMVLTQNFITDDEAKKLAPDYVKYAKGDFSFFDKIFAAFNKLKKGQNVVTFCGGVFVKAKISSIKHDDVRAIDGPVVRVSSGEWSWRVDGDGYAFPIDAE